MTTALELTAAERTEWLSVLTLILWTTVTAVAVAGWVLTYPAPWPPVERAAKITQAEFLSVELASEPAGVRETLSPPVREIVPPSLPERSILIPAPAAIAVAEPSPAMTFTLPVTVEGATRSADFSSASSTPQGASTVDGGNQGFSPVVQQLEFGQGEGKQPAPDYPLSARRQGQQGTVVIRFTVGTDGDVLAAEAAQPAPWRALTEAALRVVRDRWLFRPGPLRLYEVSIRFELSR